MANPVTDTFENTLKRQQELGADKLDFASFFNKVGPPAKAADFAPSYMLVWMLGVCLCASIGITVTFKLSTAELCCRYFRCINFLQSSLSTFICPV